MLLKTSTSHEEGGNRFWSVLTKRFTGQNGQVKKLHCIKLEFGPERDSKGCALMKEIPGSEFEIEADLVILAIGFVHPEHKGLVEALKLELDRRGNIKTDQNYMTSRHKIFAAGDARRGQSLIAWAIQEGRAAAQKIDLFLMAKSSLPNF
jgi:glutamate synthase (NADPH/NADH) small chain